jgi:hypothetical protein
MKFLKNMFKIKEFLLFFLRPKDIKKVLRGNGRENKKMCANPYYSPLLYYASHFQ